MIFLINFRLYFNLLSFFRNIIYNILNISYIWHSIYVSLINTNRRNSTERINYSRTQMTTLNLLLSAIVYHQHDILSDIILSIFSVSFKARSPSKYRGFNHPPHRPPFYPLRFSSSVGEPSSSELKVRRHCTVFYIPR